MSRRDPRKALELRLTEPLRKALVARSTAHLPLAYLARQTLRQAFAEGVQCARPVAPGPVRPILLQLTPDERTELAARAEAAGMGPEEAALSLLAAVLIDPVQSG